VVKWQISGIMAQTRQTSRTTPSFRDAQNRHQNETGRLHLSQLHAELGGKFLENSCQGVRLKTAMMQIEAVLQMLQPGFSIAAKRRNKSNPWFKRGTLFRSAVDVLRRAGSP
jgi:hypothetical protein